MSTSLFSPNETLRVALDELGIKSKGYVLKDVPERRRISRYDNVIVKIFSETERSAWIREVAGVKSLQPMGLTPSIVSNGELWIATEWVEGVTPLSLEIDDESIHKALGATLAELHSVSPISLGTWPLAERLKKRLNNPPPEFPTRLLSKISSLTRNWTSYLNNKSFVHGDWGTANVLVDPKNHNQILTIIDLEDSHIGDKLEDLRWQVFVGPSSHQLKSILKGYDKDLGAHSGERMALAAIELCIDTFSWDMRFRERSLQTLQDFVDGWLPGR